MRCSKCKESKDNSLFYLRDGNPYGWCKPCRKIKYVKDVNKEPILSKICSKCKEERDASQFYLRLGNPSGWCKPCRQVKGCWIVEEKDGFRLCKKCNIRKEYDNFIIRYNKPIGLCKECRCYELKLKRIDDNIGRLSNSDSIELKNYIRLIITRKYNVDVIDFWKIIHYYQMLWPCYKEDIKFIKEITTKWKRLEDWYIKNK